MPKSKHRQKPPRKTSADPVQRIDADEDDHRPRSKVQTIGVLVLVVMLAFSMLLSVALPFLMPR